jgi:Ca-activated chloride channel family protein
MTIDDCRLTIDDRAVPGAPRDARPASIVNRQSSIPSSLRRSVASSLLLLLVCPAFADAPRDLIKNGNELYQAGKYSEALDAYQQVGDEPDERIAAELLHDEAAAHFKLGQLDNARELWVRAAGLKDESFEAAARYNLGNCDYAAALAGLQQARAQGPEGGQVDVGGVIELLDQAVGEYRDALRLDPGLLDARANLELAAQLKNQIEQSAQQQPQSQPSSEQQQGDQQQDQQNQTSSQPSSQPSESDQQNQDKSDSQNQQDQQNTEQQQQEQQEQSQEPDSQPTAESQPAQQPEQQSSPDEAEEEQQQLVPIEMTKEEAERLLQLIRDAERQRRAILRAREAAGQKPVDKDW